MNNPITKIKEVLAGTYGAIEYAKQAVSEWEDFFEETDVPDWFSDHVKKEWHEHCASGPVPSLSFWKVPKFCGNGAYWYKGKKIKPTKTKWPAVGYYNENTHTISLFETPDTESVQLILNHELGHALTCKNGLHLVLSPILDNNHVPPGGIWQHYVGHGPKWQSVTLPLYAKYGLLKYAAKHEPYPVPKANCQKLLDGTLTLKQVQDWKFQFNLPW